MDRDDALDYPMLYEKALAEMLYEKALAEVKRLKDQITMAVNVANAAMDEIERLQADNVQYRAALKGLHDQSDELDAQDAEIERLKELLRGVGANRYWEGRWRDEAERIVNSGGPVQKADKGSG